MTALVSSDNGMCATETRPSFVLSIVLRLVLLGKVDCAHSYAGLSGDRMSRHESYFESAHPSTASRNGSKAGNESTAARGLAAGAPSVGSSDASRRGRPE